MINTFIDLYLRFLVKLAIKSHIAIHHHTRAVSTIDANK